MTQEERELMQALADDLESELLGHYQAVMDYGHMRDRFERDMANVYKARRILEETKPRHWHDPFPG